MRQKSARLRVGVSYICPSKVLQVTWRPSLPGQRYYAGQMSHRGLLGHRCPMCPCAHVCNVTQKNRQGTSAVYYEASLIVLNI